MKPDVTFPNTVIIPDDEEDAAINAGIAADSDNPELGDEFFDNAVRVADFGSLKESEAFLTRRDKLARLAQDLGMSRDAWDALSPNKPGLEERFAKRLEDAAAAVRGMTVAAE